MSAEWQRKVKQDPSERLRRKKMSGEQATMSEAMMQLELAKKARLDAVRALEKADRDVEAELLRWRGMEWSRVPALSRKLVVP